MADIEVIWFKGRGGDFKWSIVGVLVVAITFTFLTALNISECIDKPNCREELLAWLP